MPPLGRSFSVNPIAKKEGADFILGSDPDADRVGIMVRDNERTTVTSLTMCATK